MLKRIFKITIIFFLILLLIPNHSLAEPNQGKLKLKTERIYEDHDYMEMKETELDRVFPDLFKDNIQVKIEKKQKEMEDYENKLKEVIFLKQEMKENSIYSKVILFDKEYTVVNTKSSEEMEEEKSSISKQTFYISLILIAFFLCGLAFFLMKRKVFQ